MAVTLADHLRALPDEELAALIALRPDLVMPVPGDISALAVRAQSRLSVARSLDALDRFTLEVLDAVRVTRDPQTATTSVEAVLLLTGEGGVDKTRVREALGRLRELAIIYGSDATLHLSDGVDDVCSPYPSGLGRPADELSPAAAALVSDAARLRRTLLAAPPAARAVLDRLAAGPPIGTANRAVLNDPDSDSPVRWLVTRHLLVPTGGDTVELPREISLLLRRETGPLGELHPTPPEVDAPVREISAADRAGAGQAMEAVRNAEALAEALAADPAPILRSGGLGVRELRRLARAIGLTEPDAALLLEVAYAAGLLGESGGETGDAVVLPAAGYDTWRIGTLAQRWTRLAQAWLLMTRMPSLVGQRDDRERLLPALSNDVERVGAPAQRRAILGVLADLPPGTAPTPDDLRSVLAWRAPRRMGRAAASAGYDAALSEAATLGFTGLGALTSYARWLLAEVDAADRADPDADPLGIGPDEPPSRALEALDALLPAPVDHVLVQTDLTVVVPGPPEPGLAGELALVADAESPSVYRVTPDSVRRALDSGYVAADLHALFQRRSRTPVPQALTYLVDDVSRRHGGLRVGSAGAYLRGDDEALLAEVLADRRLAMLSLRRLAPTVLISPYAPARLLAALREAGYSPVPEDATGAAVLSRPRSPRAPARPAAPSRRIEDPRNQPRLTPARLAGIVEQLRRGDAATRAARRAPTTVRSQPGSAGLAGAQAHAQAMAVLQQALRDKARVWVGYVDAHGATNSRLVRPVSMGAGYLRAEDERTEMLHTFALHRITAAVPEESPSP
ncbi:hypothetical protein HC031_24425 [Planosporangium thailandense]|uniref:Helicase XPB/Ssl2 N-terminal domain-containing protein n=1 Tax=Planosporangium thailandense TaxID=765197 RepID=A0ABX0Y380_9ACTN|nr:helicase-associated domain-containing protein [Planosporangium thailandense]NJC72840.1 hypothetical protein [Planosporangium thailandense]